MAWLSGLAGKAENLLNKIDQNTAAVLNKDKYDLPQAQLTEVTWISPQLRDGEDTTMQIPLEVTAGNSVRSIVSTDISELKEEDLVKFLNMPNISPQRNGSETITPPTPSSLVVEHATDSTGSVSELSVYSTESTPEHTRTSADVPHIPQGTDIRIQKHNFQLGVKMEQPNIISVDSTRTLIENERNIEEEFSVVKQENKYELNKQVGKQAERLFTLPNNYYVGTLESKEEEQTVENRIDCYIKQDMDQQKEIAVLTEKLETLEAEKEQLLNQLNDFQITLERNRSDLYLSRSELEQHKARALRTLQEKEKLIAELKNNVTAGTDDAIIMELNQLRQERDILREENQQISEQLRIVRDELDNADVKLEKMRHESTESNIQAQEILTSERRRRLDAEEDTKLHSEEIRSLKDELFRQHSNFAAKLKNQESEISKLKLQLSASSTPSSEVESRLTSLTQTLVIKQQALESLTTERNALRLQLEKREHEFKTALGNNRRNMYSSVNDTDDAKAQVPTFLIETPFDTGVTRRVKRAYSSLDAISIRTGVFLRRYPLARILVLIYMALLQFWVLVVLLSESPDAR